MYSMQTTHAWICACAVVMATRVHAQRPLQGSVAITGGSATDVVGTTSRALTVAPALAFTVDPRLVLGVGATGTRYDDQRWSLGGQATAAARVPMGSHAALTLNADGGITGTSYDFSYNTASALPAIEATAGSVTAYAGATAAVASTRLTRSTPAVAGLFGDIPGSVSSVAMSRSSRGFVAGGAVRLVNGPDGSVAVGVRAQRSVVDTTRTLDRSASIAAALDRVSATGSLGWRSEPGAGATFGSATLAVAVDSRLTVEAAGGAYPADHLIGTRGGRFLTVGLSVSTARSEPRTPSAAGVPDPDDGMTRLTIRATDARRVDVAGDFSNWKPIAATRAPNGVWFTDLRIPPGQYRYAFRIDGSTWAVPDGAATVSDGFGGKSAWLVVSGPPTRSAR